MKKMEKNIRKRPIRLVLALLLVMALSVSLLPDTSVKAAVKPKIEKKYTFVRFPKMKGKEPVIIRSYYDEYFKYREYYYNTGIFIENSVQNKKIRQLKSSNPKVLKVKTQFDNGIQLLPKKPGKSRVTFQYAGKKFSTKVTIKNYANPCKSFKVGKKDYAKKFDKTFEYGKKGYEKGKAKVSITPKKGWKIISMYAGQGETNGAIQIKNNTVVDMDDPLAVRVGANFKNKKTGEVVPVCLYYGMGKNGNM